MEKVDDRTRPAVAKAMAGKKECRGPCGKEKFLDEFPKNPGSKDGHENTCKACRAEWAKDRYKKQKEQEKDHRLDEEKKRESNPPEEKVTPELATPSPPNPELRRNTILYIDIEKHPDLMDRLIKAAEEQMRTPELQALFYIKIGLKTEG